MERSCCDFVGVFTPDGLTGVAERRSRDVDGDWGSVEVDRASERLRMTSEVVKSGGGRGGSPEARETKRRDFDDIDIFALGALLRKRE